MTESVQAVADIVIETVSPSTRKFHSSTPFMSCGHYNIELEDICNKMEDGSLSEEDFDRYHKRFHELEDNDCPIVQAIAALDTSEEKNMLLDFDHSCVGGITVTFNLAVVEFERIPSIEEQVIAAIAEAQWTDRTLLTVKRAGS